MATSIQNSSDSELIDMCRQCYDAMKANLPDYPGVTGPMIDDLKAYYEAFEPEVTLSFTKQAEAKAQTQKKDAKRVPAETQLAMVRNIATAGHASAAAMAATGIPTSSAAAPATATRPIARVDTSQRLEHTIHWTDQATPDNKKKPRGTMGAEIYRKLDGPPPTDPGECTFVAVDSATPYLVHYTGEDAGKMAHYMLRWHMSDGTNGPWSETISATITG